MPSHDTSRGAAAAPTARAAVIRASWSPKTRASTSSATVRCSRVRPATSKNALPAPDSTSRSGRQRDTAAGGQHADRQPGHEQAGQQRRREPAPPGQHHGQERPEDRADAEGAAQQARPGAVGAEHLQRQDDQQDVHRADHDVLPGDHQQQQGRRRLLAQLLDAGQRLPGEALRGAHHALLVCVGQADDRQPGDQRGRPQEQDAEEQVDRPGAGGGDQQAAGQRAEEATDPLGGDRRRVAGQQLGRACARRRAGWRCAPGGSA